MAGNGALWPAKKERQGESIEEMAKKKMATLKAEPVRMGMAQVLFFAPILGIWDCQIVNVSVYSVTIAYFQFLVLSCDLVSLMGRLFHLLRSIISLFTFFKLTEVLSPSILNL